MREEEWRALDDERLERLLVERMRQQDLRIIRELRLRRKR